MNSTEFPPIERIDVAEVANTAPGYLLCCALSLSAVSAFLRAGFILKLFVMFAAGTVEIIILWSSDLFRAYAELHSEDR